jgi:stage V sporulation protein AC
VRYLDKNEYKKIVKSKGPKEDKLKNIVISFFIGGVCGIFGQALTDIFNKCLHFSINDSYMLTMVSLVLIGSILTGLGFFDKVVSFCKCGLIVPTTGFAHAMTSAAMDSRNEGFVKGIGTNIFKLTGSIILYGIIVAFFVSLLKVVIG